MATMYPPEYVREVSMEAFEAVMAQLKGHVDDHVQQLAQVADACFMVWQLAGETGDMAMMTIGETLPVLLWALYPPEDAAEEKTTFLGDFEEDNKAAKARLKALDALEVACNWSSPAPTHEETKARERWRWLMNRQNEFEEKWDL